jgi:exopolysaccharide biosynthesis polyprenyl glycosylphosphotransferase
MSTMQTESGTTITLTQLPVRAGTSRVSLGVQRGLLQVTLVLTDAIALAAAFATAYWIRFELQLTLAPEVVPPSDVYKVLSAVLVPVWLSVFAVYNLYDRQSRLGGIQESSRAFNACTAATMLLILGTFMVPEVAISRMWVVSACLLSFAFVATNRFAARRAVYGLRTRGYLLAPAVIVGTNKEAVNLAGFLGDHRASGLRTIGFISTGGGEQETLRSGPVLGRVDEIQSIVAEHGIEEVIVAITALSREELLRLCQHVEPLAVQLRLSSGVYELLTTRVEVRTLGTVPLMSVHKIRLDRLEVIVKTLLEASLTSLALLLAWPVLAAIAIWIKLDSPGPVLHRRRVLGVSGRPFDAFKFRTMHVNGHDLLRKDPGAVATLKTQHKLKKDPRVTRAGRWLRRYSLDEVPQLFNVLLGQMSLVGPRMISPDEAREFGDQRMNLLTVKPGITGLWQVSGRSDLSYAERVRMDLYYIRNYSVWLDLQILFIRTIPAVIKGQGAY